MPHRAVTGTTYAPRRPRAVRAPRISVCELGSRFLSSRSSRVLAALRVAAGCRNSRGHRRHRPRSDEGRRRDRGIRSRSGGPSSRPWSTSRSNGPFLWMPSRDLMTRGADPCPGGWREAFCIHPSSRARLAVGSSPVVGFSPLSGIERAVLPWCGVTVPAQRPPVPVLETAGLPQLLRGPGQLTHHLMPSCRLFFCFEPFIHRILVAPLLHLGHERGAVPGPSRLDSSMRARLSSSRARTRQTAAAGRTTISRVLFWPTPVLGVFP